MTGRSSIGLGARLGVGLGWVGWRRFQWDEHVPIVSALLVAVGMVVARPWAGALGEQALSEFEQIFELLEVAG